MHLKRALVTGLGILCILPAAASAGEFSRRGFYIGVGGAAGVNFFEDQIEDAVNDFLRGVGKADVGTTWGINARVGYRIFSFLAVEAHYEWMNNFKTEISATVPGLGTASGDIDYTTHTIVGNLKLVIPTWRIQPYLLLGVGAQYGKFDDETGIVALLGGESAWGFAGRPAVGIDFYITKNVVLNAEVAGVLGVQDFSALGQNLNDLFYLSAGGGIQWRF